MKRKKRHPISPEAASFERALRYQEAGRSDAAYQTCLLVLRRTPGDVRALGLLGTLDFEAGRTEQALKRLERTVELAPNIATNWLNLGLACHKLGRLGPATESLARAVQLEPERAHAVLNLGLVLLDAGDSKRGLLCLTRAAVLEPNSLLIQQYLAEALFRAGSFDEGMHCARRALALDPTSAQNQREIMAVLDELGRLGEAEVFAREVIALNPNAALGYEGLGRALASQGKLLEAVDAFSKTLQIDPTRSAVAVRLGFALSKAGRVDEAIQFLKGACETNPSASDIHSALVFFTGFSPQYDAEALLIEAQRWSDRHALPLGKKRLPHPHDRSPERRLRIGYVSPYFCSHVQRFFMTPVLRHHDRENFEVVCYSSVAYPDAHTQELQSHADQWHDVHALSDGALAEKIRADQIDVLVDLTMHMSGCRLKAFAERPAPVQIAWLAYPGTTGVDGMDYRITDPHLDPLGAPMPYSERSLWVSNAFWCYEPQHDESVGALPAMSAGHITFGCLNEFMKVNRQVLELWARVLASVPGSRLLLLAPTGWSRSFVLEVLSERGISEARVEFVEHQRREEYLATYHRIDIALDTFPYNGHTTSLDGVWMGVPVVTLVGRTIVGRAGFCLAQNLELQDWVAHDLDQFVETAIRQSSDLPRLAALRADLRARLASSPLMDAPRFTRDLEGAYRDAWRSWCG